MVIDALPQVHSQALQLKQQAMLLIDSNQTSLQHQVLSSESLLVGRLHRVRTDALQQHELQHVRHGELQLK